MKFDDSIVIAIELSVIIFNNNFLNRKDRS